MSLKVIRSTILIKLGIKNRACQGAGVEPTERGGFVIGLGSYCVIINNNQQNTQTNRVIDDDVTRYCIGCVYELCNGTIVWLPVFGTPQ